MDHYIDLRLRPDAEFSAPLLMGALFSNCHKALVRLGSGKIGVSFPAYTMLPRTLGECLRLHGDKSEIKALMELQWLTGMADHVQVSDIACIPKGTAFRVVSRVQPKTNADRLRRRYARRHQVTDGEAKALIPDSVERVVRLPYLNIRSQSTGQQFSLFVNHKSLQSKPVPGAFNAYGMSTVATIPWF